MSAGWKDKLAGGFTNGLTFGGNKDHTLTSMWILAMQHGKIWAGPVSPSATWPQFDRCAGSAEPIGSALGVTTQSDNAGPEVTPTAGDKEFARLLVSASPSLRRADRQSTLRGRGESPPVFVWLPSVRGDMDSETLDRPRLLYFADTMCSWCYGFAPEMNKVLESFRTSWIC